MPFVKTLIQNNSDRQQKDDTDISPRAESRIHSPASSIQRWPRSQNSGPSESRAAFPLPQLQSHSLPMTPLPKQPPDLPNPIRDSQPSNSNTLPNLTSATDKGKIARFTTKIREK